MSFYKQDTNYKSKGRIWQFNANQLGSLISCCSVFTDEALTSLKMPQSIPQRPKICREPAVQLFYQTLPLCSYFVVWGVPQNPRSVLSKFFLVVYSFTHPLCKGLWAVRATFLKILNPKSFEGKKRKKRTNLLTTF